MSHRLIAIASLLASLGQSAQAQDAVPSVGRMKDIQGAQETPDPRLDYRIVFDVRTPDDRPGDVSPALQSIAALINNYRHYGVPADHLHLATMFHGPTIVLLTDDETYTFSELERLRALGIQILMDDFGVGYSSLSYFHRFPFDKVKIDKSFIDQLTTSRAARAIVHAVVGLGSTLDMRVVAEGVETEDQMRILVEAGCTHLQGYLFSVPLTNTELEQSFFAALEEMAEDSRLSGKRAT